MAMVSIISIIYVNVPVLIELSETTYTVVILYLLPSVFYKIIGFGYMSLVIRKPVFCICENKDADRRLCFRYTNRTIPLLPESEISRL